MLPEGLFAKLFCQETLALTIDDSDFHFHDHVEWRWLCFQNASRVARLARLKCTFTVVKTPLYCTRKCSCNLSCTSALSLLQLLCNGSTDQVPLPEHEISHGTPGTCTRCVCCFGICLIEMSCSDMSCENMTSSLTCLVVT